MKNHGGEIATLLTLGLVLVGTLITLGTSLLVNNKKNLASNPKAAALDSCNLPDNDSSCWLVKCINKQPGKIKYTSSLCQSSMPTSSCKGGSPYSGGGKMIIGIAASHAALDDFTCEPGSNIEITPIPGGGGGCISKKLCKDHCDEACTETGCEEGKWKCPNNTNAPSCTDITCKNSLVKGTTSDELSYDENGIYYEGSGCEDAEIGYVGKAQGWCDEKSATGCSKVTCKKATGNDLNALS